MNFHSFNSSTSGGGRLGIMLILKVSRFVTSMCQAEDNRNSVQNVFPKIQTNLYMYIFAFFHTFFHKWVITLSVCSICSMFQSNEELPHMVVWLTYVSISCFKDKVQRHQQRCKQLSEKNEEKSFGPNQLVHFIYKWKSSVSFLSNNYGLDWIGLD